MPLIYLGAGALLVAMGALLSWTPPAHEVHTVGGIAMTDVRVGSGGDPYHQCVFGPSAPSTSLDDLRCGAWRQRAPYKPCPDGSTLRQTMWPAITQATKTLYIATVSGTTFNVEFLPSNRTLVVHCYFARAWLVSRGPPGIGGAPMWMVLVVPTDLIGPGVVSVVRDDRVEHWLGDDVTETVLGRVEIP